MNRLTNSQSIHILKRMLLIRQVELSIAEKYAAGEMRCPTHLSVGQECTPGVLSVLLNNDDLAVSTHRAHAHYMGKGGDVVKMLSEIYGKESGCAGGRGGSMHLIDKSVGFMGSTAIVGNTIPIGVGLGLSKQIKNESGIAVVFLGDGAVEEGVFYESANFAATRKLPVLFVCENNLYSVYSSLTSRQPENRKIHEMVSALGLMSDAGDGNDVIDTFDKLNSMIQRIRDHQGAGFVELSTYRWLEHCGPNYDNDIGYRSEEEFLAWKAKEPIQKFIKHLLNAEILTESMVDEIRLEIQREVELAFSLAQKADFPDPDSAFSSVYASVNYD